MGAALNNQLVRAEHHPQNFSAKQVPSRQKKQSPSYGTSVAV
jgi:hypothetical protein